MTHGLANITKPPFPPPSTPDPLALKDGRLSADQPDKAYVNASAPSNAVRVTVRYTTREGTAGSAPGAVSVQHGWKSKLCWLDTTVPQGTVVLT